ncbi:HdeD family acid-resistance protein [Butyrivibrio sp. JL13D10]|uniref:HdeD family acid-resistance protein n=1 Tax=Butyrivibrio sp. JL13D10 TaxID=3236815 RepID=UPI0038B55BE8
MGFFVRLKKNILVDAIALLVVGLVLIFLPGTSLNILTKVIGAVVLAAGVISVLTGIASKNQNVLTKNSSVGFGLVIAVVGVWILINPEFFEAIIPVIAGVIMLFSGLMNLGETLSLGRNSYKNWWVALILAAVTIAAGAFLVFNPITMVKYVVQIIGAALAYNGASNLWIISRIHKVDKVNNKEIIDVDSVEVEPHTEVRKQIIDVESRDLDN